MDDQTISTRVGAKVREVRKSRGLRLREVSERSGITLSMLSRIELGDRELGVPALIRLARALDVPASVLLGEGTGHAAEAAVTLVDALPHDPEELRARVLAALRQLSQPVFGQGL